MCGTKYMIPHLCWNLRSFMQDCNSDIFPLWHFSAFLLQVNSENFHLTMLWLLLSYFIGTQWRGKAVVILFIDCNENKVSFFKLSFILSQYLLSFLVSTNIAKLVVNLTLITLECVSYPSIYTCIVQGCCWKLINNIDCALLTSDIFFGFCIFLGVLLPRDVLIPPCWIWLVLVDNIKVRCIEWPKC